MYRLKPNGGSSLLLQALIIIIYSLRSRMTSGFVLRNLLPDGRGSRCNRMNNRSLNYK